MSDQSEITQNDLGKDNLQQQVLYQFKSTSDSGFVDDDNSSTNKFYLNLEGERVSYICGSDVLIGASETIETDISPALGIDSTNVNLHANSENLQDDPSDTSFIILSNSTIDDAVVMMTNSSHEILDSTIDPVDAVLDTSTLNNIVGVLSEDCNNIRKVIESKTIRTKKVKKGEKKVKCKRGRKPHFSKEFKPKCTICAAEFTNTASLKTHMLIHSGERPFQCDMCEKTFTRNTVLRIHRRLHTGEKPYKCKLCSSGFVTKEALARHVVKDHPKDDPDSKKERPSYVCEVCNKGLCSKYSLQSHMNIHRFNQNGEDEAGVKCKFCKKNFTCRYTLQRHVFEKHNRRGIITCNVCEQSFSSKWEHSRHQDLHAPTREYQCDLCAKTFEKKFQLLYHLQVHEAEKNTHFSCYLCKKEYTIRESFLDHIRGYVECEMQIYSCPQCPISFSDPRQLKLHLNETHKLPVISDLNFCDICKISFDDANDYYEHLFGKHDSVEILCNECSCYFKSRRQYDEHFMAHNL